MNRRGFLGLLGGIAATAILDPERLLWKPGEKVISVPKPLAFETFEVGDIITIGGRYAINPLTLRATDNLKHFVVTRRVESQDRIDLMPLHNLFPPVVQSGQFQNVASRKSDDEGRIRKILPPEWIHPEQSVGIVG